MFWNIQFDWNGINCFIESNLYSACQHHSLAVKDARILKIDYKSQNWFIFCINTISSKVHIHIVSLPSNDYHCSAASLYTARLHGKSCDDDCNNNTSSRTNYTVRTLTAVRVKRQSTRLVGIQFTIESRRYRIPNHQFRIVVSFLVIYSQSQSRKKKIFSHSVLVCVCEFAKRSRSSATEEKKIRCVP